MKKRTATEYIHEAPKYFDSGRATGLNARIGVVLSGSGGGHWTYIIVNGRLAVEEGLAENLDGTMSLSVDDWLSLNEQKMDGAQAFREGRITMEGNMKILRKVGELFVHG